MSQEHLQHHGRTPSSSMSKACLVSVVIICLGRAFADRRLASVVQRLVVAMENQMVVGAVAIEMKVVELESLYLEA